jgi:hypothetical protein
MGGVVKTLFGGSGSSQTSSSQSGNNAFGFLKDALGGNVTTGNNAFSAMAAALGLGGGPAQTAGVNNFMNSAGYQTMMDSGSRAITGSAAAKGLLGSGSVAKGLTTFGQNLGQQGFTNYLGQLMNLFNGGQQSAATIGGAGAFSNSNSSGKSSSQNGIIPVLFG